MSHDNGNLYTSLIPQGADASRTALITAEGEHRSYREVDEMSARYANALVDAGLKPGDRLIAVTQKGPRALALYLGALRAGATFVPLNPAFTTPEIGYFVGDAEPRLVVVDPDREAELSGVCAGTELLTLAEDGAGTLDRRADLASPQHPVAPRDEGDIAAILYTSGTTGRSKGAMLSHANLLTNARTLQEAWAFSPQDVLVHALPIFHTHGLFVGVNVSFLARAAVILLPRFDPAELVSHLPQATVLMGVPTFYTRLLALPDFENSCADIRLFVSGSAPLAASTHDEWRERTGHAILERYGMTETTMLTSNPLDGERRAGTVGLPLPGVSVRIRDAGESGIGMIEVSGPNVFAGYWRMPEKTAEEFTEDGFFRTGDLGEFDDDGYLRIVGREKDLVISGGYNIYPKEVETVIDAADGVLESAVFGVADSDVGERVIAAVVARPGTLLDSDALERHVAERLARYKRPREYLHLAELPRNTMGKVQKNVLRANYPHDTGMIPAETKGQLA